MAVPFHVALLRDAVQKAVQQVTDVRFCSGLGAFLYCALLSADPAHAPLPLQPAHLATGVAVEAELQAEVSDPDEDSVTAYFYGREAGAPGEDFTIIAMPDTQHYTDGVGDAETFQAQTEWIVANREALNIVFVTGLGDIVQNGSAAGNDAEWQIAHAAYSSLEDPLTTLLDDGIPFGLAVGNHDQSPIGGGDTASTLKYNQYFGESRFLGREYYGGHYVPVGDTSNNDNHYQLFSAGGMDFIIIHFEYDTTPLQAVLDWADELLTLHSDRRAILTTHYMIDIGNPANWGNQGLAIYNALKEHENLFLMLGGHQHGEGRRQDVATYGNVVNTLLSDYQSYPNGGNGLLRIMRFSPANDSIQVMTYSPALDEFEVDDSSEFTLSYPMDGVADFKLLGSVENLPSGETASLLWPDLKWETGYEWYVRSDDGVEGGNDSEIRRFTTEAQPPELVPPATALLSTPDNPSASDAAVFAFSGSDNLTAPENLSFECRLDSSGFSPCGSPAAYSLLEEGMHVFQVRAIDGDGNTDTSPASYSWLIDFSPTYKLQRRIAASADDAEENLANGAMDLTSTDLELVLDSGANPDKIQRVGLRFTNITIPPGATVLEAWVEFETDETGSATTSLAIQAQAADNPTSFTNSAGNISARSLGSQQVSWSPGAWSAVDAKHRTPDLTALVQQQLDRSGWTSGNSMVLVISGSGQRIAEAFDGEPENAPLLVVEYSTENLDFLALQQGHEAYSGTVDTFLADDNPDTDYSASSTLVVDRDSENHVLLRFEGLFGELEQQIPPGSKIYSAMLEINVTNESDQGALLHRVLQDWNDSDSWNDWNSGIDADGIEAREEAESSSTGSAAGLARIDVTADLQAWADGETNRGWAWLPPPGDNSWQFNSAEGAIPPRLSVFFLGPVAPQPELIFDDGFE